MSTGLRIEELPDRVVATLDRPEKRNAIDTDLTTALHALCAELEARPRLLLLTGGADGIFAAGADIKELAEIDFVRMSRIVGDLQSALGSIADIPKPTVAAITGYALGGGLELALGADRRIIGDNVKLGTPEILLGVIPGGGGTQRLARLVGPSKAKDIVYTGRSVGADEALAMGLVDEVVAPDDVYEAARRWAAQFTTAASRALAAAKAAIDQGLETDLVTGLAIEQHLFASLFATKDRTIGMESFLAAGPGKADFVGE